MDMTPNEEADRATELLAGQVVTRVTRYKAEEIIIEFGDGSRFCVGSTAPLYLSITNIHD